MYLSRMCLARFRHKELINKSLCELRRGASSSYFQKNFSNKASSAPLPNTQDPNWVLFYKLPAIKYVAAISRLKLLQTGITLVAVPVSAIFYANNTLSLESFGVLLGTASLAGLTLYLFSFYFQRLIGLMYFKKETQTVKICHLTFWGRRNDFEVPMTNIMLLSEGSCNAKDIYVKLYRYNADGYLMLSLRFGKILEQETFDLVVGKIEN